MNDTLLLLAAGLLLGGWGVFIFTLASRGDTLHGDTYGMCAPARYDAYTAQPAATPRRIIAELAPPAGWRDVVPVAAVPAPAAAQYDDFDGWDENDGDELPLIVEDWPKLQAAQTEPLPIVVNWTAARFANLEVRK